ncbi:MAG: ABC transporter substrate-binding protein [Firmicutes bacterium HGW-Firmicutes-7]|nr:MAG: ABC transporter substrate-binding protein [Firmicutes bacterium HGW-Firmicutes-7]
MKKIISVLMLAILVLGVVGCGAKKEEEIKEVPVTNDETTEITKTKITIGFQADPVGGIQKVIDAFETEYPQYEVEFANMTNDSAQMHDQLLNSLSSGSGEYDVIAMDVVWAGEFAAAGYLEPVDTLLMDQGWKTSDFNAGSMASGKYQGKNYALPFFPDLGFLYYRKDIVSPEDAAKLEAGTYTWEDLLAMSEKYVGQNETTYGFVYQSKQYEGLICNLNEFSKNWTDVKGGLETMNAFVNSNATPEDILVYTEGETHAAFTNKEAVFARNWPYMYGMAVADDSPIVIDEVGLAPLPNGGTVGGWLIGLNKNTDNLQGAKDFATFLAGDSGQRIYSSSNASLPGMNSLLTDAGIIEANTLLSNEGFKLALTNTIARPVVANYQEVSDQIQVAAHAYLSGSKTLEDAVTEIESALQ